MKSLFLLMLLFLVSFSAYANELKIEVNPAKPVVGEVFQAYFRIFTESDEEPAINFSPSNLEVVGKSNQGISTRTVYANGKLTVSREMTFVYELVGNHAGMGYLRDINVQLGNKTIRHPLVSVNILKEREELGDIFVMADVPKKSLYLNEGVTVTYFLYHRIPAQDLEVKKYPKLNGFLKRFLQDPSRSERVAVDGQVFMRTQIYAAKLFPEKVGELKVDPLQVSINVANVRSNDPFGAFAPRDLRKKTLSSDTVKIEVKPLPEPVPPHFTGLIGQHEFNVQFGQTRLIVNEPLEVKLTVSGAGALENLEAPDLFKHPGLEEFETNGDLKISSVDQATKEFSYTYLAKENLTLPAKEIVLSYFDPRSQQYVQTHLKIPEIVVAGGSASSPKVEKERPKEDGPQTQIKVERPEEVKELAGPVTLNGWEWKQWLPMINLSLAVLALIISLGWIVKNKGIPQFHSNKDVPSTFKKGHFELGEFTRWLSPLILSSGKSPLMIIKDSPLSSESKKYFIDLLSANDYKEYASKKSNMDFKYVPSHFRELSKYIASMNNEDPAKSS